MREFLLLLVVAPFGLLVVLNNELATFQLAAVAPQSPMSIVVAVPTLVPTPGVAPLPRAGLSGIVDVAMSWLGTRYLWGGCTRRGVDCSCYVRNVLASFGISAPRTTTEQVRWAAPIARDQIQPGDLIFFDNTCSGCGANPTHVGLAIGGGLMVQAGDPVQISPIFSGYYASHYASAGRPR